MFLHSSPLTGGYPPHGHWGTAGVGLTVGCVYVLSVGLFNGRLWTFLDWIFFFFFYLVMGKVLKHLHCSHLSGCNSVEKWQKSSSHLVSGPYLINCATSEKGKKKPQRLPAENRALNLVSYQTPEVGNFVPFFFFFSFCLD